MELSIMQQFRYEMNQMITLKRLKIKLFRTKRLLQKTIKLPKSKHKARFERAIRNKNYATNFQSGLVIVSV